MYLQNLHTHSHYCDGADSPEEMICTAMEKALTVLVFWDIPIWNLPGSFSDGAINHKNIKRK